MTRRGLLILLGSSALPALSGCAGLPAVGPSASDVVSQSVSASVPQYELVAVTADVAAILNRRPQDSFLSTFGDYRPSLEPRIGVGDTLSITIWEAAAGGLFSAPLMTDRFSTGSKSATIPEQVVARDGAISVPYAGRIRVAGQTIYNVQRLVERALDGQAIQPQALVSVVRPVSNSATVVGEVSTGARVPLSTRGDRLMDVVASAGGTRAPVNEIFIQVMRGSRAARVSMTRVMQDPRENIYVRPDDVITLVREPQRFVAYGATGRNAEVAFESETMSLAEGLAKAGGLLDHRSDPAGIFVIRYETAEIARKLAPNSPLISGQQRVPIVYRLDMTNTASLFVAQRFPLFAKDVLYVSNAPGADLQKVFQIVSALTAPAATGASVYAVTR